MKSGEITLLAVAAVAIGTFALPNTVSLFSGQHSWYDLGPAGSQVPCEKCHDDIADEMALTGAHVNIKCEGCHRTDARVGYAIDLEGDVDPGQGAHAASTQECMICHTRSPTGTNFTHYYIGDECGDCHGTPFMAPPAGGFNLTGHTDDTGEKAAHLQFVQDSMDEPLMEGANEACIACHTRIGVNITWTKNEYLGFTASEDAAGNWSIPSFAAGGENVTQVNTSNEWTSPP